MKNQDNRIVKLTEKLDSLKKELHNSDVIKTFKPITNCVITLHNLSSNINTINKFNLVSILVQLNAMLDYDKNLKYDNFYYVRDYVTDIENKLSVLEYKEKKAVVDKLQKSLSVLLSEDKKIELEIDDIESLINGI